MTAPGFHTFANGAVSTRSTTAAPEADIPGSLDPVPTSTGEPGNEEEEGE